MANGNLLIDRLPPIPKGFELELPPIPEGFELERDILRETFPQRVLRAGKETLSEDIYQPLKEEFTPLAETIKSLRPTFTLPKTIEESLQLPRIGELTPIGKAAVELGRDVSGGMMGIGGRVGKHIGGLPEEVFKDVEELVTGKRPELPPGFGAQAGETVGQLATFPYTPEGYLYNKAIFQPLGALVKFVGTKAQTGFRKFFNTEVIGEDITLADWFRKYGNTDKGKYLKWKTSGTTEPFETWYQTRYEGKAPDVNKVAPEVYMTNEALNNLVDTIKPPARPAGKPVVVPTPKQPSELGINLKGYRPTKAQIEQAVREGKAIPQSVLQEYGIIPPLTPIIQQTIKEGEQGETPKAGEVSKRKDPTLLRQEMIPLSQYDNISQQEWLGKGTNYATLLPKTGKITIYRATPKGQEILPGDYVTQNKKYAQDHIEFNLKGKGKITSLEVGLDEIFPADAPNEFWYAPKAGEVPQAPSEPVAKEEKKLTIRQDIDKLIQEGAAPELFSGPLTIFDKLKEKGIERIAITQALRDHLDPEEITTIGKKKIGIFSKDVTANARPFDEVAATMGIEIDALAEALRTAKTRREAVEDIKKQIEIQKENVNPPVKVSELELEQGDKFQIAGEGYKVTNKEGQRDILLRKDFETTPSQGEIESTTEKLRTTLKEIEQPKGAEGEGIELGAGFPLNKIIPKKFRPAWQEFWSPMSTLPESKKILFERSQYKGKEAQVERIAGKMLERLKGFDNETQKSVFSFLNGDIPLVDLPVNVRSGAESTRQRIITIGKMLVKRKIISPETFEEHKGNYVPYLIAKHMLKEGREIRFTKAGKLDLAYTKQRNPDLTMEERRALGLIENASIAVPYGMRRALRDIATHDYFKGLAENPDITWQPSRVKVLGRKIGIGNLVEELKTYKNMIEAMPENKEVKARYDLLNSKLQEAIEQTKNMPEGFTQMPTSKHYGPLAGAFVKTPIANDILPLYTSTIGAERGKIINTMVKVEREGMALFKSLKVAVNVPTAFRNLTSNILQNNMRGRNVMMVVKDYIDALRSVKNNDTLYTESQRNGNFASSWAKTEIDELLGEFLSINEKTFWNTFLNAVRKSAKYYGKIDDISKHAIYVQMRKAGHSQMEATVESQKWGMDYSLGSRSIKEARRHILPFITYQYKIAPLVYESMTKRPWVIGKYLALPFAVATTMTGLGLIDKEEWKRMKRELPYYMKRKGTWMVLPWKDEVGHWQWVNIDYFFPWGNLITMVKDVKSGEFKELARDIGVGNPFLDLLQAFKSGVGGTPPKHPFTGQPIYNQLDDPEVQWLKLVEFLYNEWAPSMLTRYGALGYTLSIGQKDRWGKPVSPGQATGRWFGFNITAVSPEQTMAIKKARIKELEAEKYRLFKDPYLSDKRREKINETFIKKKQEILEGGGEFN